MSSSSESESPPRHRRWQFSIRALLIWTAVVALYFGVLRILQAEMNVIVALTCWIVVGWSIRVLVGVKAAVVASFVAGAVCVLPAVQAARHPGPSTGELITMSAFGMLIGGWIAGTPLLAMELVAIFINRIDTRSTAEEEQHRTPQGDAGTE